MHLIPSCLVWCHLLIIIASTVVSITVWHYLDFKGLSDNADKFICGTSYCHEFTYTGSYKWCEKAKMPGEKCLHEVDMYEQPNCPPGGAYLHLPYDEFKQSKTSFSKYKSYKKLCRSSGK